MSKHVEVVVPSRIKLSGPVVSILIVIATWAVVIGVAILCSVFPAFAAVLFALLFIATAVGLPSRVVYLVFFE